MSDPIDFYFDFSSPYGYLAAKQIDGIAERHGRRVTCFMSVAAARGFYWLSDSDPATAKELAMALYDRAFGDGGEISSAEAVIAVASGLGIDADELRAALNESAVKARLKAEVNAAIERGVFGSPYIVVDGEPFWGHDKLAEIDRWLETGGW
jgi:2-hydroxychromene-2-carboxylate isomerase